MIPKRIVQSMIILAGFIVVFGRMCIAGTWIDDFSDRTLRDWGGEQIDDQLSATVVDGHFNYRGKKQNAQYRIQNYGLGEIQDFSLQLKFMVRHIRVPEESFWLIQYFAFNEETGKYIGIIEFEFRYDFGNFVEPNVALVSIVRNVAEEHPQFGPVWRGNAAAIVRFAYEKEVWYTLRIEREGNRYIFWIGDFGLFTDDDSVPIGSIGLHLGGRCNIWLDDFAVTGPTVPDGGPGVLGVNLLAEQLTTTWGSLKAQN